MIASWSNFPDSHWTPMEEWRKSVKYLASSRYNCRRLRPLYVALTIISRRIIIHCCEPVQCEMLYGVRKPQETIPCGFLEFSDICRNYRLHRLYLRLLPIYPSCFFFILFVTWFFRPIIPCRLVITPPPLSVTFRSVR